MSIVILLITLIVYLLYYVVIEKNNVFSFSPNTRHVIFLVWVASFFFLAIYIFESGQLPIGKFIIYFILIIMIMFAVNIIMVAFFVDQVVDINTPRQRAIALLIDLGIIFFFFSFVHYFIYWNNNDSFDITVEGLNWFDVAISFIYYSFSTSLTYSASGIEPISSTAKILSMVQIAFFYLVLGESLFSEIQKRNDS
ncbi:hypothetical protein [Caryophanon latum]|uniref:Potassium channel domain-containing protein n=1 Tax=Caryophanon latum TaxID=33977 RepID=A0A1C0YUM1_9BACL|nr:hypothetical protein [Caryophanon latum]OCS90834.1 hypothetical protein A6K76_01930 [Caryophanon latum]